MNGNVSIGNRTPVITIDGPSGAGKGTIAQRLSEETGFALLDSGALYRLTALAVLKSGVGIEDSGAVAHAASKMKVRFESVPDQGVHTFLDGMDVSLELRNETTAAVASQVAAIPVLRRQLLQIQRDFRKPPGLVADGRDMGTVVFPDAEVKIFLTASALIRAQRRLQQLRDKGIDAKLGSLLDEIRQRDERDSGREASPLKPASDAVIIDSSQLDIDQVYQQALELVDKNIPTYNRRS